jgi:hypothetical protein
VVEHQRGTRPWINEFFWVPATVGLFVVFGVAVVYSRVPAASLTVSTRFRTTKWRLRSSG